MGCVQSAIGWDRSLVVLFVGLDGSGSTTTMYQFANNEFLQTIPTLSSNQAEFYYNGKHIESYDLGGGELLRPLWKKYAPEADGVVFSIDSTDVRRVQEACSELSSLLNANLNRNLPVLIYANKQDLANALPVEVLQSIVFSTLSKDVNAKLFPCVAKNKKSLDKGMKWLTTEMSRR